jgi:hypothetical protein
MTTKPAATTLGGKRTNTLLLAPSCYWNLLSASVFFTDIVSANPLVMPSSVGKDGQGRPGPAAGSPSLDTKPTVSAFTTTGSQRSLGSGNMSPPPSLIVPPMGSRSPIVPPYTAIKRALPIVKKARVSKKPKQILDTRSTITAATDTIKTPVNVYDAVLGEAQDLLQAAREAQALGRLRMASAYQLLLHARLVGLGKRFDRAILESSERENQETEAEAVQDTAETDTGPSEPASPEKPSGSSQIPNVQELSKLLPDHIEIDSAMIEHLARAAMELHHKRTGRRIQSDLPTPPPTAAAAKKPTLAWTEQEKLQCQALLRQGLSVEEISQRMKSRTEAQVRAFVQNQKHRQREVQTVEEEHFGEEPDTPRRSKGRGRKPPTQAMNTVPNAFLNAKELLAGKGLNDAEVDPSDDERDAI